MHSPRTSSKSLLRPLGVAVAGLLAIAPLVLGGQGVEGTHLTWDVEDTEGPMVIDVFVAPEHLRVDMGQTNSMIYRGDAMVMVMHSERAYMVFTREMMEQMGAMMGGIAGQQRQQMEESGDFDAPPSFTRTGNTKQIGSWDAYEVKVTHPEQTGEMTVWMSEDVDVDLVTFVTQMAAAMEAFTGPMIQGMAGGGGGGAPELGMLGSLRDQITEVDLPEGFPVQVITVDQGETSTMTLTQAEQGSLGADTFQPPSGYQEMQMPGMRR